MGLGKTRGHVGVDGGLSYIRSHNPHVGGRGEVSPLPTLFAFMSPVAFLTLAVIVLRLLGVGDMTAMCPVRVLVYGAGEVDST